MAISRCFHHRSLRALFLLLLVLFLSISTAKKQEKSAGDDVDVAGSALIDWIRASGGHSDVRVGLVVDAPAGAEPTSVTKKDKAEKRRRRRRGKKESSSSTSSSSALRGTIATRDIAAGEVIIRLPSNLSVPLGGTGVTSPVRRAPERARAPVSSFLFSSLSLSLSLSRRREALLYTLTSLFLSRFSLLLTCFLKITFKKRQHPQENVVLLFARRASDPAWFRVLAPYWDSLPASVFTKEMYEPEHMELLQDEELVSEQNERENEREEREREEREKETGFLSFCSQTRGRKTLETKKH